MKRLLLLTHILVFFIFNAIGQRAILKGKVFDNDGVMLGYAYISIDTLKLHTTCDKDGEYTLESIPAGKYKVTAALMGYEKLSKVVLFSKGEAVTIDFKLTEEARGLKEVVIAEDRHTETQKVREQAFTVTSIDAKSFQNLNLDVNAVLNRTTGVRIRQEGGLGSDFSFSLNGFTGKQIRFFIDGLPADYLGSSLSFNNIPVNIVDRIEVYKGVVPVSLGADALGGAVNIVTNNTAKSFLDASYSFGSFNTHQAAIAGRFVSKKGFVLNTSGFFNYSDNNYHIDASVIDRNTGKIGEPQPYRRFNDGYLSASVIAEAGVINKPYADKLLIGIMASGNRKEIQQGANMTKVAGQVFREDISIVPTLKYQKSNLFTPNLTFKLSAFYAYSKSMTVDTSSRIYDWDGSYSIKSINVVSGELNWDKTLFRFNDHATLNTASLEYQLKEYHTFTLSNTFSWFQRQGSDPISYSAVPYSNPNVLFKNIMGLSYKLSLFKNRWNTTVFGKVYNMNARVYIEGTNTDFEELESKTLKFGGGVASTVFIVKGLQAKVSYEYASRMPESYEMFGDGLLLLPNPTLKPEQSHNINAGFLYGKRFGAHLLNAEVGFVYRKPNEMVRLVATGVRSQYENLASASVTGYEGSVRYAFKHWFSIELNATYQDLRNTNKENNNYPDPLYKDRLPNIPYLFGNAIAGFKSPELSKYKFQVGFDWSTLYVEQFYLKWPSQGQQDDKLIIPRQISHDASVSLSAFSGTYNINFSCLNIADAKRYDNFKVQKPGRSFNVKFRVYLTKFSKQ